MWDVPVNSDWTALDGLIGGNTTISLSSATTLLLSVPATGSVTPSAGPNQSQNAIVKFTGALTANSIIRLTLPRLYVFDATSLAVATSYLQIAPASGTGTVVALPPGETTQVSYDGTNVKFMGLGRVGSLIDMVVATTPAWIAGCSVPPYVLTNGAIYSTSTFPILGAMLGSTFGGNGITTFGVPDTISRLRISIDPAGLGRVTATASGVDGATLGATGGSQYLQQHNHTVTDPGHAHLVDVYTQPGGVAVVAPGANTIGGTQATHTATTGLTVNNIGSGTSQNMPPTIVFGLTFIKT